MQGKTTQVLMFTMILGLAGAGIGFLIGGALGMVMTWLNNNVLIDAPQGSYLFWARFMGLFGVAMGLPLGLSVGLILGLSRKQNK